ncbi:MAG: hypothetical protein HC871_13760, partial [Rhizobiales bacterium]|nr:hypothetical protein [Hyphomicrobiales bacterium]
MERRPQLGDAVRREVKAGGDPVGERRLVGVDHRVGKAADPRHDRHAAIAQTVELGEAAGLEAGRDQDGVGARLELVGERLVIAEHGADPA